MVALLAVAAMPAIVATVACTAVVIMTTAIRTTSVSAPVAAIVPMVFGKYIAQPPPRGGASQGKQRITLGLKRTPGRAQSAPPPGFYTLVQTHGINGQPPHHLPGKDHIP